MKMLSLSTLSFCVVLLLAVSKAVSGQEDPKTLFKSAESMKIVGRQSADSSTQSSSGDARNLGGTSWQLVKFQGGDETTLVPDDKSKYTITFETDGRVSVRIDCNRGSGRWRSLGPNQLEFGPLALTRMICPPGSLHDQIARQWSFVRSYIIRDGHFFLSLMADGGIYEFEPIGGGQSLVSKSPVASRGPIYYQCTQTKGETETLSVKFYQTKPATALVERGSQTRPAFQVPAASGRKYEGEGLMFWAARDEALVTWLGVGLKCKSRTGSNSDVAAPLLGTRWRLTEVNGATVRTARPYIQLDSEAKRFFGDGGCNRIRGSFEVDGLSIKFSQVLSTRRTCLDGGIAKVEKDLLRGLGRATTFSVQSDVLLIYGGAETLTFRADSTGSSGSPQEARVTGTVTYRQRIALTPSATLEVKLLDVSRADAPSVTVAEQIIKAAGRQVPFAFELRYDPRRIDERGRYAVQARILAGGKLRFINTQAYPVLTGGHPDTVNVVVEAVRR